MADLKDLNDLLYNEIQVLYSGEELLVAGIARMIDKAHDKSLKAAFTQHLDETKQQLERLKQAAKLLNIDHSGDGNPSMKGLIAEGEKVMHKDATPEALDAALIAAAQKIEHYEIAGYGTAAHLADGLGFKMVADLLRQTLQEEQNTDTKLNDLAKNNINRKAAHTSGS
jgi:ferritin-like metal-binding protein YciE